MLAHVTVIGNAILILSLFLSVAVVIAVVGEEHARIPVHAVTLLRCWGASSNRPHKLARRKLHQVVDGGEQGC
jgi:hypothetical protein